MSQPVVRWFRRVPVLAFPAACAIGLAGFARLYRGHPVLFPTFLGSAGLLLAWTLVLALRGRARPPLEVAILLRPNHWLQACAQLTVLLYWGWHIRFVYSFLPFIVAQLIFAYGVDSLLAWTRRGRYELGFGPFPVILSINLFLWFRFEWFYWQMVMIALGLVAKDWIRWNRDGRLAHVFNPSSFPLAVFSLALLLSGTTDVTFGRAIASTQYDAPGIYLVIFLAALPGQLLFGVARMTLAAVVALYGTSLLYLAATGTYLFFDSHIPVPVFLGMHLLFPDPSTSPRTELGRLGFGVLYGVLTAASFSLLGALGAPTFYDKLLPVPILNLLVRRIDGLARGPLARLDPARLARALSPGRRNLAYTGLWAGIFVLLLSVRGIGDRHPGQYLPFWQAACEAGSDRACTYASDLLTTYCDNGSGWACNEVGVALRTRGEPANIDFRRACILGFPPACANANAGDTPGVPLQRGQPLARDLPIVLRGTHPMLRERDPERLTALACEQGWPGTCAPDP